MTEPVLFEVTDGVAVLTLNAPRKRNAIDGALAGALIDACERIDADLTIGSAVIQGAGGYFCSGGDRDELAAISAAPASDEGIRATQRIYDAFLRFGALKVPTVAAVRGGAVGAGMNLALAADVRVVAEDAVLASGFTRLGVHPGGGHYTLLTRVVTPEAATVLGVLGESVDGRRAVELGLAYEARPDEEVEPRALALAARGGSDPALTRAAIRSLRAEVGPPALSWPAAVPLEQSAQLWSFARKGSDRWKGTERASG
ncbi:enoyl-CoA hydratase/isomerase family protein [Amycolatopsis sp. NPDC051372]|uniref:enoyl-CoA hydratase/isomerase family protein n=1 Tax=Amycolatopsis sp. NPDC051372 TaxID=3155669 RepID=UPI003435167C